MLVWIKIVFNLFVQIHYKNVDVAHQLQAL